MSLDELKNKIINYIQKYAREQGKPPTIKSICDNIDGVNRSNFYKIFQGIGEACNVADVEVPEERIESTAKAVSSRRSQKARLPQITLNEETSKKIQTISYIENKTPQEVIDELIENDRTLRQEYGLYQRDVTRLSSFLRNCENNNINKNRIINSLIRFTNIRLDLLSAQDFNLLIDLWNDVRKKNWSFNHVVWLYESKVTAYNKGYSDCMGLVPDTVIEEIGKNFEFASISRNSAFRLGTSVAISLGLAGMRKGLV